MEKVDMTTNGSSLGHDTLPEAQQWESEQRILEKQLKNMGVSYVVVYFKGVEDVGNRVSYEAEIRSKISDARSDVSKNCDAWIDRFSLETNTNWVTRRTMPNGQRYVYRKVYACQHASKNKTKSSEYKNNSKSRDFKCTASLDLKVNKTTPSTLKKDKFLKLGLNAVIKVHFVHSHLVDVAEAYRFLRISDDTQAKFNEYFANNMTVEDNPSKLAPPLASFLFDFENLLQT